jgi:hypothetical protein
VTTSPAPNLTVEISCTLGAMPAGNPADSTYDNQRSVQYVWCGTESTAAGCLALG